MNFPSTLDHYSFIIFLFPRSCPKLVNNFHSCCTTTKKKIGSYEGSCGIRNDFIQGSSLSKAFYNNFYEERVKVRLGEKHFSYRPSRQISESEREIEERDTRREERLGSWFLHFFPVLPGLRKKSMVLKTARLKLISLRD